MTKNLVIVESPAKAKTIEKILGKDFEVKSSFGHVRDLESKGMSIDIENGFKPNYKVNPDKTKVVAELKKLASKADTVWLATDEDREGEAIAWHLVSALKLDDKDIKRIVFHEITEPAIKASVKNPRAVDKNLVDAQQARRVLDRLVGYELSPVLWKKVQRGLSAGRVQSVAVRLIVEKEREIRKFETKSDFKLSAKFSQGKLDLDAEYTEKLSEDEANKALLSMSRAEFSVADVESKEGKRSPAPPFTTSTLQQAASQRLGYSVKQTMVLAQRLYESGKITYMRTDSVNLSQLAIDSAKTTIVNNFGQEFSKPTQYKTKSAGAQEAHEAIRPSNFDVEEAGEDEKQKKLYKLIRSRALASQMSEARVLKTEVKVNCSELPKQFSAKSEIVTFEGYLKAYPEKKGPSVVLPKLEVGSKLDLKDASAKQIFAKPPARYTEASLVKKLEEMGIGRPSTYAPTISTIQDRGYISKGQNEGEIREIIVLALDKGKVIKTIEEEKTGSDKGKLLPTEIGIVVTDFLSKHFGAVVDYDFTANVEKEFDKIADGKEKWNTMIADFYGDFHKTVESAEDISRKEASGTKKLGKDPKTGKTVYARIGKYGPMIQVGEVTDEEKPQFAPMPAGKTLDNVELTDALPMLELPRKIGKTDDGQDIISNIGPYGPYIKVDKQYISIKPETPFTITKEQALEFIKNNSKEKAKLKDIKVFEKEGITIKNGRYGPYITDGKKNARIPKDTEPDKITLEIAQELLSKAKPRRK